MGGIYEQGWDEESCLPAHQHSGVVGSDGFSATHVILRISSVAVPESNLNDYLDHVQRNEIPSYAAAPGLVSVWLLERPFVAYVEVMTISTWRCEKAITRFVENCPTFDDHKREYGGIQMEARIYKLVTSREGELRDSNVE